jgi:hypothetical protein
VNFAVTSAPAAREGTESSASPGLAESWSGRRKASRAFAPSEEFSRKSLGSTFQKLAFLLRCVLHRICLVIRDIEHATHCKTWHLRNYFKSFSSCGVTLSVGFLVLAAAVNDRGVLTLPFAGVIGAAQPVSRTSGWPH